MTPEEIQAAFARMDLGEQRCAELYDERDANVRALGFSDYGEYLQSRRFWRGPSGIRQRVLRRDKSKCATCGTKTKIVHHRRYTLPVLTGEDLRGLITLCDQCHQTVEFDRQGIHRTRANQEWVLDFMQREMGIEFVIATHR